MIDTYLINLDGSDDRLSSATAQLAAEGIGFTRVPAFDGRGLTPDQFPDYDAGAALNYMGRPLRGGEIGCYLSHLDCARRMLDSGATRAMVLEDDMQLPAGFAGALEELLAGLDRLEGWDLVNLGANKHRIYTPIFGFGRYALTDAHYFPMTTTGLIWSRQGAEAFVQAHDRIFAPVDNYFRHWQTRRGRGLAVWPGLVTTTGAESLIANESGPARRSSAGRHPLYGLLKQRRLLVDKLIALRWKYSPRAKA
ncbi:MAG: glycosyltransferase family 25 protein [Paracoccus sp. (in: a-proteobacteria)]|uniref:glycosyltransferase family 25 protein n=1 Tax=Paracoccus sp. TaxID=267 RepID=UPI0026DFE383|nr:glycosyltransferase family 25 protein [Paracoccus sp. (in: a-proteobacteria)]MDO5620922.1 glycosyltransferase family 25 protein [Paracoccus sp. (in: a-proteobacteria)]